MARAFAVMLCTGAASSQAGTTYGEVSAIFGEHCVGCHRPGRIGPMSLRTYDEVRPWAKAIAREVAARNMPPFHAAGPIGRYAGDPRLTEEEIGAIVSWVEDGAQRGDLTVAESDSDASGVEGGEWVSGEPDIVIEFPRCEIVPGSEDPYFYLFSQEVFGDDVWLRGFEWKFDDYRVAHHAILYAVDDEYEIPPGGIVRGKEAPISFWRSKGEWLPGLDVQRFPERTAYPIETGSRLVLQIHYAPPLEATWDRPRLGIYLADGEFEGTYGRVSVDSMSIEIGPHESSYRQTLETAVGTDAYVHGFLIHMHYRGRSATIELAYPDGRRERVFELPSYNFNWQRSYLLAEPFRIPEGTKLIADLRWDNSADNPQNPDPTERVVYGSDTRNEMGTAIMFIVPDHAEAGTFKVVRGRRIGDKPVDDYSRAVAEALEKMEPAQREELVRKALDRRERLLRAAESAGRLIKLPE